MERLHRCTKQKTMPLDPATTAALSSSIDTAGSVIASGTTNKQTRKWNEKMYNLQREHSLQDWEMQNAYNSPEQQMARLKAAGLNPHLVYGNGAQAMSGQQPRSSDTGSYRPETPEISTLPGLMAGYDMQAKQAQTDNIKQMTEVAKADQVNKAIQSWVMLQGMEKTGTEIKTSQFDLSQKERLQDIVVKQAESNLETTNTMRKISLDSNSRAEALQKPTIAKIWQDIQSSKSGIQLNQHQIGKIDWEIQNLGTENELKILDRNLKAAGIQPGDPAWMRIIIQALSTGSQKQSPEIEAIRDSLNKKYIRPR